MKRLVCMLLCGLVLASAPMAAAVESISEATTVSASEESEHEDKEISKGAKIAGFLGIFTVSMGVTAYIIIRPKLKRLKEIRKNTN